MARKGNERPRGPRDLNITLDETMAALFDKAWDIAEESSPVRPKNQTAVFEWALSMAVGKFEPCQSKKARAVN